jgi:hypothetical protein
MVVILLVVAVIVLGAVLGGAREQDLSVRRLETVQAFYAVEAGMNMALREIAVGADEDADGLVGSISDDGNDANDPALGTGQAMVVADYDSGRITLTSEGRSGASRREAEAIIE